MIFVDTLYWVAAINPRDPWRGQAEAAYQQLGSVHLVTTQEILVETLNAVSRLGVAVRQQASTYGDAISASAEVTVLQQTPESFSAGLRLYRSRLDNGYSLTDCISMQAMRERGIQEVLTHDHHFEQGGFVALLRKS